MTTTEFHNALLQGHGKCVLAVRENPDAYRDEGAYDPNRYNR